MNEFHFPGAASATTRSRETSPAAMTAADLRSHLAALQLTQTELAQLLGTNPRTVRRWLEASEVEAAIPGAAACAVRAWDQLRQAGLAWRPGDAVLGAGAAEAWGGRRFHEMAIDESIQRVAARGGPAALWDVDLDRQRATLGCVQLIFKLLDSGGFAPASYRRTDELAPDAARDARLLEDGYACIARALARAGRATRPAPRLGPASIVNATDLVLWEQRPTPTLAVRVPLSVARAIAGAAATDIELKAFVELNRDTLLAIDAYQRLTEAGQVNALGVREVVVTEALLRRFEPRVATLAERGTGAGQGA